MKYIYDLISKPNIITENGLNIIILQQNPHKIINNNIDKAQIPDNAKIKDLYLQWIN